MDKLESLLNHYLQNLIEFIPNIVSSIFILVIGLWIIKSLEKLTERIFLRKKIDPTFISFLLDVIIWGLRILLFITIASKLGIQTSSFIAILGAMSLAVGLSLQGSLANFAGGVLIILFKPFRIGDVIEAQGEIGKVYDIHIFSTKIVSSQNQVIYIPNGVLSNGKVKNFSQNKLRKAEINIQTSLTKNTNEFMDKLMMELNSNEMIMKQPKPKILIKEVLDTKITYSAIVWIQNDDYAQVSSFILLKGKEISDSL